MLYHYDIRRLLPFFRLDYSLLCVNFFCSLQVPGQTFPTWANKKEYKYLCVVFLRQTKMKAAQRDIFKIVQCTTT